MSEIETQPHDASSFISGEKNDGNNTSESMIQYELRLFIVSSFLLVIDAHGNSLFTHLDITISLIFDKSVEFNVI